MTPAQGQDPEHSALLAKFDCRAISPEVEKYALRKGLPYWSCRLSFYGPVRVITAQWEYAKEKFSAIPGATFQDGELIRYPLTLEQIENLAGGKAVHGVPSLTTFGQSIRGRVGNTSAPLGHVWFAPTGPRTGEGLFEFNRVWGQFGADTGLAAFSPSSFKMPWDFCGPRTFMYLFAFRLYADMETAKEIREGYRAAAKVAEEHGFGEYRAHPVFYDEVMDAFSYNNHALLRLHETIKDAVDPNGILSAGRYGVWPKHLRQMKEAKRS